MARTVTAQVFCVLLGAVFSFAWQNGGVIEGVVTDSSGGLIPGTTVVAEHVATNVKYQTTSDDAGRYHLVNLPPGEYEVSFQSPGFRVSVLRLKIASGQRFTKNVTLDVGSISETIEVSAGVTSLQTSSASVARSGRYRQPDPNTEEYGRIKENRFREVYDEPLSTFSIDVDTASYSNVRRFLRDGEMPPADAVRVEELINYFRYNYPEPADGKPFTVVTELAECPWQPGHQLLHVGLKARSVPMAETPPNNLVFLLDVSGSMSSDDKLPLLKRAFSLLARQMRPQDRVAIVVYAGAAGLVLPSTPGSETGRILAAISELNAGGSTAGGAGIQLAYKVARDNFLPTGNNRVILATDSDFNVGLSTESALVQLIEKERESGTSLSVLGFGTGNLKDSKMEQLADHGNGNYAYIDSLLEARRVLVEQLGGTLLTLAKDVKLQLEFNPARISSYRLIGYENRLLENEDFDDDVKDAGELGAGHTVTALYELIPAGARTKPASKRKYQETRIRSEARTSPEAVTVKLRYKNPKGRKSQLLVQTVDWQPQPLGHASEAFRFSAAAAGFGMLLRSSEHSGDLTFQRISDLAEGARSNDPDGRRAEFLYLVRAAERLSAQMASK
jgi:Ca-activated chloride channel homolog